MSPLITRPALTAVLVAVAGSTSLIQNDLAQSDRLPDPPMSAGASFASFTQPVFAPVTFTPAPPLPVAAPIPTVQPAAIQPSAPQQVAPQQAAPQFSTSQLDTALGPIALYPDPLLAQIFAAATYPLDIVQAARWVNQHADLAGLDDQSWDPSVKAIARFKSVLTMMDQNLEWTVQLGQAYTAQPQDVMGAVQRLRNQAYAAGALAATPQQQVIVEREVIRIVPAQPEVIYVPVYNPQVVYVRPADVIVVNPPVYCPPRWCAPVCETPYVTTGSFVSFSIGFTFGQWCDLDCDWRERRVCYRDWDRGGRYGRGHDGYRGNGAVVQNSNDVTIDQSTHITNIYNGGGGGRDGRAWQHDDSRRRPVRAGSFASFAPDAAAAGPERELSPRPFAPTPIGRVARGDTDNQREASRLPAPRTDAFKPRQEQRAAAPTPSPAPAFVNTPAPPPAAPTATAPPRRGTFNTPSPAPAATPAPAPARKPVAAPAPKPAPTISPAPPLRTVESKPAAPRTGSFNGGTTVVTPPSATPAPRVAPSAPRAAPSPAPSPAPRAAPRREAAPAPAPAPAPVAPAAGPARPANDNAPAAPPARQGTFGGMAPSKK